jgi:hypothetical protein
MQQSFADLEYAAKERLVACWVVIWNARALPQVQKRVLVPACEICGGWAGRSSSCLCCLG